jgi:hypothetical protein
MGVHAPTQVNPAKTYVNPVAAHHLQSSCNTECLSALRLVRLGGPRTKGLELMADGERVGLPRAHTQMVESPAWHSS